LADLAPDDAVDQNHVVGVNGCGGTHLGVLSVGYGDQDARSP
jgi:hypothetical protein